MRQTTKATKTQTAIPFKTPTVPMKKVADSVLHVRVPSQDLQALKKANVNIPELVRRTLTVTLETLKD